MRTIKSIFFLSVCLSLFILASCDQQQKNTSVGIDTTKTSDLDTALLKTSKDIEKAIYAGDYETLLKYYKEDAVVVPTFEPVLKGKIEIQKAYAKEKEAGVKIKSFHTTIDKIWEHSGEIFEYGTYAISFTAKNTKHPRATSGSYFMIWEKQKDKSFLIKYFISNLDFNPCTHEY